MPKIVDDMLKPYTVTSLYGERIDPITKQKSFHAGIDMAKEHKSPILAFVPGDVIEAGHYTGYGNMVTIRDKDNNTQLYAHLDSITVQSGSQVQVGQEIGKQGTTGRSTGSHLHYEVRIAGQASRHTDPIKYTKKYWTDNRPDITEPDLGAVTVSINGYKLKGMSIAGVSMVPVSSLAQALGKTSSWNAQHKTVTIE